MQGLSQKEVEHKRLEYGLNEIRELGHVSKGKILLRQVKKNFVIYLLAFAVLISFIVGKTLTAYTIIVIIAIVILSGFFQEYKAERSIRALRNMTVPETTVIREGKERKILSQELVPGDIIIMRTGERVPADALILEEKELRVEESVLTGESRDVRKEKTKGETFTKDNIIYMGTYIVSGKCTARILHTGLNTEFGKIARMISTSEKELLLQKKVNKIAKNMVLLALFFAIITGIAILIRADGISHETLIEVLIVMIAIAVAGFPEGFPVVLISTLAYGAHRMAQKNAIINRMSVIETLGETTVICSDKTGTITSGEMTVKKIWANERILDVSGVGYDIDGEFTYAGKKANLDHSANLLLRTSALCNDSRIEKVEGKEHVPHGSSTEAALLILGAKGGVFKEDLPDKREEEIPFSSERKMMSVVCKEKDGLYVYSKGATEILLSKSTHIQKRMAVKLTSKEKEKIENLHHQLTSQGYRVIALAYKKTRTADIDKIEHGLTFLGLAAMEDPPREGVKHAIHVAKEAGITVKMITGDNKNTAEHIAQEIGISGRALTGDELDKMTDEELADIVQEITLFARVRPEHKLRIVKALKTRGEVVTMTGDGVNDAPALKESHIGVAMGKAGTDVSKEAADIILKDDNFATIVDAIKEGRTIFSNLQKFTTYQLSINLGQLLLITLGAILGLPLPLLAIQILFMNLFSDEITAIALAFNPYSHDIMQIKPRKNPGIFTKPLFSLFLMTGLVIGLFSLIIYYYFITHGYSLEEARTTVLISMVLFAIVNAFNYRSFRKPVYKLKLFANRYLIGAAFISFLGVLLVVYIPPLNVIFHTISISGFSWLVAIIASLAAVIIVDIYKLFNQKRLTHIQ
ncbi:MAG: cation-transporting P-type ATPase [Nanoarchaeota archaeon]